MSVYPRIALTGVLSACALGTLLAGCIQQPPEDPPSASAPAQPQATALPASPAANENPQLAAHMKTPEFRREYRTKQEQLQNEAQIQESAPWLGHTGLSDAQERALPRYVRMELGQTLQDAHAVQAQDLEYMGNYPEPDGTVYYWRIPDKANAHGDTHAGPAYAYIRKGTDGVYYTDWGNRTPPLG